MSQKLSVKHSATGKEFDFELNRNEVRIGRSPDVNELVLDDERISRRHAVLRREGNTYLLIDLKSVNGTAVNGKRIEERLLANNDLLEIGGYSLLFDEGLTPSLQYDSAPITATALMLAPDLLASSLPRIDVSALSSAHPEELLEDIQILKKKAETLAHLYELNRLLSSTFSLEDIFEKLSDMILRLTPADRFLVLLSDKESGELNPFFVRFRSGRGSEEDRDAPVSKTVVDRVLSERIALLSSDARADERFAQAQSLTIQRIHSIMCVPLSSQDGLLGLIYVDGGNPFEQFDSDHLDLLNALATAAAMATENAASHAQLVKEALARATYKRFLPQHVVNQILADPNAISLGGISQAATILFSDIRGFTALAETMAPDTVLRILNDVFSGITPVVFEYEGILDKFIGDGLMALFGVPYQDADSALKAVGAAIAMQERLAVLNHDLRRLGLPSVSMGTGINTGNVTVGYVGSAERTDYTAIGDAVNLAARLEKQALGGQILISQTTREALADRYILRPRGELELKGKRRPVQIFEVLWQESQSGHREDEGEADAPPAISPPTI